MTDGQFGTFNVGNALLQREQIIGARQANQQQNILAQRAAQFNPLLQQHLQDGDQNVLAQMFALDPQRAIQAQEFQQTQITQEQAQEKREAIQTVRGAILVRDSASPLTFLRTAFPEFVQGLEDQGTSLDDKTDDEIRDFAKEMIAEFGAVSGLPLEELGIEEPTGAFIQFENPTTGEIQDVRRDSPEADRLAADPNFQQVERIKRIEQFERRAPFGTPVQLGKLQIDINEQAAAVNSFGAAGQQLLEIVGEGGANTLTAGLANVGNRLRQEVRTLASRAGVEFESGSKAFDQNNFKGAFQAGGLAGENARVKNAFLALAIQRAIASGLGSGRALSDKDISNQLETLGQNQSDPLILRQIFIDDFRRLSEGVRFRAQASNLAVPELVSPEFIGEQRDPVGRLIIDLRQ